MKAYDIAGYTFAADIYCAGCIIGALPTGPGQAFDGWALAPRVSMTTEANLNEIATAFGIDRMDEHSFDSDAFPKVVFADQVEHDDRCGGCGEPLL